MLSAGKRLAVCQGLFFHCYFSDFKKRQRKIIPALKQPLFPCEIYFILVTTFNLNHKKTNPGMKE